MSPWLIALVGAIYLYVALDSARIGGWEGWALAVMYVGYAFANVGAWMLAVRLAKAVA